MLLNHTKVIDPLESETITWNILPFLIGLTPKELTETINVLL